MESLSSGKYPHSNYSPVTSKTRSTKHFDCLVAVLMIVVFLSILCGPQQSFGFKLGLHMDLTWNGDASVRATAISKAKSINATVSRNSFLWHLIEPAKGFPDWSRTDAIVQELSNAGIEPLFCIYGSPPWANGVSRSTSAYHYLYVPTEEAKFQEWLTSYVSFVTAAATRYKGKVKKWELWNEQNISNFWKPSPNIGQYVRWFQAIQGAIKSVDPTAEIALGGLAGLSYVTAQDYNGKTFLTLLYQKSLFPDIVAVHPYSKAAPDVHVKEDDNFDDVALIRQVMLAYGQQDKQIWVTEWGWSTTAVTQQTQADWLTISLQLIKSQYTYVSVATFFLDYDRPNTLYYGLFTSDFSPKPAASAFYDFAATLTKPDPPRNPRIIRIQ